VKCNERTSALQLRAEREGQQELRKDYSEVVKVRANGWNVAVPDAGRSKEERMIVYVVCGSKPGIGAKVIT
jgi:hypothetical protein